MKVYAVVEGVKWEYENVNGIYSTYEKALERAAFLEKQKNTSDWYVRVDDYELDIP